jgi:coproporphyrinogen III oxidase-like Fe-S oxidoreductase
MAKVKHIFTEVKQRNIETEVSLIFGLPGQTVESFKESVDFCKSYNVPKIYAFPLMLLRGTPIYDQKRQLGLIESTDINLEKIPRQQQNIPHVVASQTFNYKEWLEMANIAESLDDYNQSMSVNRIHTIPAKMSETLRHTFWNMPHEGFSMRRSESIVSNTAILKK